MMENFCCSKCFSLDRIRLECGHIQCRLCLLELNKTCIQCDRCDMLPVSNKDLGITNANLLCNDCGINFDSNAEYERHKKKKQCCLAKYGCYEQIDLCSTNKHFTDERHINAIELCLSQNIGSTNNINFMKKLTECLSQNDNITNESVENEEIESLDDKLVLDFGAAFTSCQIEDDDSNQMTDENRQHFFADELIRSKQVNNLIQSRIEQLDVQQNNNPQSYNGSILEEQVTVSTMQKQLQRCHSCNEEYDVSLSHLCHISASELQERLNKLSLEMKQKTETNKQLAHIHESLVFNYDILQTALSNVLESRNGVFIWLIKNIAQEIGLSYSRKKVFIDSPKFSSLTGGHPLNIRLYLYGDSVDYPNNISIHIILNSGGKKDLCIPITCCLVDQTKNHQHIIKQKDKVNLGQANIGIICRFLRFVKAVDIHREGSRFVENDTLCLIVKLHENELNQYSHYSIPIQNALQQIDSLLTVL